MKVKYSLFFIPIILLILFTRFFNLEKTGVFYWDQTIDLVRMHQYFVDRTLTLVGPISEDGSKVFGSLTYYMLMPFAILGKFDTLSTTLGAAFWGSLTAILIILLTKILNKKMVPWIAVLTIAWFPLIELSRSAWNPYLIPFWIALGLILYQKKNWASMFLAGICFGLSIHNHYLAVFAGGIFILINTLLEWRKRNFIFSLYLPLGFIITLLPFILFDLRHPPGLFLSRILYFNHTNTTFSWMIFSKIWENWQQVFFYYTHLNILSYAVQFLTFVLLFWDLKKKNIALIYFFPFLFQIIAITFISDAFNHYFLPGLAFFIIWVVSKRDYIPEKISQLLIVLLIISSVLTIRTQLEVPTWAPNIKELKEITNIIDNDIRQEDLKNVNIAVLGSADNNTYGRKYRDLLLIKNVKLQSRDEYSLSDHLFVVTQSSEDKIRVDAAVEMTRFRNGPIKNRWLINDSDWKIYLFDRNKDKE